MLQQLIIQNFTLVDHLHLEFNNQMTTISGETGAGKSILLDALGLALGNRAESGCVRNNAAKADIHAVFDLQQQLQVKAFLADNDLVSSGDADTCILRRIVNQDGRSRGYINGKPVNITLLKQTGSQLINIHGQHEHQHLLAKDSHIKLLDAFSSSTQHLQHVQDLSQQWHALAQQAKTLTGDNPLNAAEQQLLSYQVDELDILDLSVGELESLEQEHKQLSQAEQLLEAVNAALPDDSSHDPKAILQRWQQQLSHYADSNSHLASATELIASAVIQIEESQSELNAFLHQFDQDPARLQTIENRLDAIYNVARKHKIQSSQLLDYYQALTDKLTSFQCKEADLASIIQQQHTIEEQYITAAQALTQTRQDSAKKLQQEVAIQLQALGMQNCRIEFSWQQKSSDHLPANGMDTMELLVQTNPGQPSKLIGKIASGGELSRISLAIQVVIATTSITPSLIFDEVDVGIGGATAEVVGRLLAQLGQHCQLLCITHLPQVASQAQHHLQVIKQRQDEQTHISVQSLSDHQRVYEIARMLGGVKLTDRSLAHAKEMLGSQLVH